MKIINNRKIISLEELSQEEFVLFDTSPLMHPLGKSSRDFGYSQVVEKIRVIKRNTGFIYQMINKLENGTNFFTIQPVLDELLGGNVYKPPKGFEKGNMGRDSYVLKLRQMMLKREEEKIKLAESFSKNKRIISSIREDDYYSYLENNYKKVIERNHLSDTDKELLFTGLYFAIFSVSTSLVINDYPLFYAGKEIVEREKINKKNIKFFDRKGFSHFRLFEFRRK